MHSNRLSGFLIILKKIIGGVTLSALVLWAQISFSEIYTWVDEKGRKNFGDKIPERFQKSGDEVSLNNLNTMLAPKITKTENVISLDVNDNNEVENSTIKNNKKYPQKNIKSLQKNRSCDEQVAEYQRSLACFSQCRNSNGSINRAKCPTCENVVRPSCYLNNL